MSFVLVALLSAALLPLGLFAIIQHVARAKDRSEIVAETLVAETLVAASLENQLITRAFGAADVFAAALSAIQFDPDRCTELTRQFLGQNEKYSAVFFIPASGEVTCSSAGRPIDLSQSENLARMVAEPAERLVRVDAPVESPGTVIASLRPMFQADDFIGMIAISALHDTFLEAQRESLTFSPAFISTVNSDGQALTNVTLKSGFAWSLPPDFDALRAVKDTPAITEIKGANGEALTLVTTPLVPGLAYTYAIWDATTVRELSGADATSSLYLPFASWILSILIAYLVVERFMLRDVEFLRGRIRQFGMKGSAWQGTENQMSRSREIAALESAIEEMAKRLSDDNSALKAALARKDKVAGEIHHRIRNNLQMVMSLIHLHRRHAIEPETNTLLRQMKSRVQGLTSVQDYLYQAKDVDTLDTQEILNELWDANLRELGEDRDRVAASRRFQQIDLPPENLLSFVMLLNEISMFALTYLARDANGAMSWDLSVSQDTKGEITLHSISSTGNHRPIPVGGDVSDANGLGADLMQTLTDQLGGQLRIEQSSDRLETTARLPQKKAAA